MPFPGRRKHTMLCPFVRKYTSGLCFPNVFMCLGKMCFCFMLQDFKYLTQEKLEHYIIVLMAIEDNLVEYRKIHTELEQVRYYPSHYMLMSYTAAKITKTKLKLGFLIALSTCLYSPCCYVQFHNKPLKE